MNTKARAQITVNVTIKFEPNQSSSRPRSSTTSREPRKVATNRKPITSNRLASSGLGLSAGRRTAISAIVARPTGPLIKKHQRQVKLSASQPPRVGPTTGATTTATPNRANACPRFCGGKASAKIDCDTGTMPPPARPCRIRNRRSEFRFQACAHRIELTLNSPRQIRKKILRPNRRARKRARRQADGVGDQIGRHHPGRFVRADPHAASDIGQHHVGDRGVEHLHKGRKRDQNGDDPRVRRRRGASRRSAPACAAASLTPAPATARSPLSTSHRA